MSVDRMDFILGNEGTLPDGSNSQGIFPETYFTCSGTIQSWIFGAQWIGASELLQLQIWRAVSGNDDLYILVESTTVNITEENETQLYHYPLSSPLSFQPGDILGIFQPYGDHSQLIVGYEYQEEGQYQLAYFNGSDDPVSPQSHFNISGWPSTRNFNMLVNVVTGECLLCVTIIDDLISQYRPTRLWMRFHEC